MNNNSIIQISLRCGCPKCGQPNIFKHRLSLDIKDKCNNCGLDIKSQDSGDGPAVLLVFLLGLILTPLALWCDSVMIIPLWMHAIIWCIVAISACLFSMQPMKAYFLSLNYKYRGKK